MILDIILVAIVTLLVIIGIKRGIARTLLNLLSVVVSAALAYVTSKIVASWVYTNFISTSVTQSVSDTVSNSAQSADIISQETIDNLPDFIKSILQTLGIVPETISGSASKAAADSSNAIAQTVDDTIAPVVTSILSAIFLVVLFIIFLLICKLIARKLVKFFDLPVLNVINRLLGGTLGLIEGVALCYIAILICRIILPFSSQPFIPPEMIEQSVIFKTVYYSEFMNSVAGILSSGSQLVTDISSQASTEASQIASSIE